MADSTPALDANDSIGRWRMNRTMELTHLAIAEKAVAQGERHIQREEEMIAELDRAGHDTKQALTMLATYRKLQAQHVAHRDQILKALQQQGGRDISAGSL
jgi:hypothetical protein